MERSWWSASLSSFPRFPSLSWRMHAFDENIRMPVCDMVDKGDHTNHFVEALQFQKK
ncbi:MAG TPA: hypothetical protein VI278_00685 [Nitrososphaeraceae archaeon]